MGGNHPLRNLGGFSPVFFNGGKQILVSVGKMGGLNKGINTCGNRGGEKPAGKNSVIRARGKTASREKATKGGATNRGGKTPSRCGGG